MVRAPRLPWALSFALHGAGLAALVAVAVPGGAFGGDSARGGSLACVCEAGEVEESADPEEALDRPALPDAAPTPVPPPPEVPDVPGDPGELNDSPAAPAAPEERPPSLAALFRASPRAPERERTPPPRPAAPVAASAEAPRLISGAAPDYPPAAADWGASGLVVLRIRVGADGRVVEVAVHASSGWHALDEAAVAAARGWIFEPARLAREPVEAWVEAPIRFALP